MITDDCFIATNYEQIIDRISAVPLARARIKFSTVMASVEADQSESGAICLTDSDGSKENFDEVVITTPLGWLKQHKSSIKPLSARISRAIDSISFGRLEKVFNYGPREELFPY